MTDSPSRPAFHRDAFDGLLARAERSLAREKPESAASLAQLAASRAAYVHHDEFVSTDLEALLERLGSAVPVERNVRPVSRDAVLHVVTEMYSTGGHSRFWWRWAQLDDRPQGLVFTRGETRVPPAMQAVVRDKNIQLHQLTGSGLVERASQLASLATGYGTVVLNLHPFDVVPPIAFAARSHDRVALLNLADHLFWCGRDSTTAVIGFRELGNRLCVERRGLRAARLALLPIPIEEPSPASDSVAAKRRLGIDPDTIVVLSAATPYKFESIGGPAHLDVVRPVVDAFPNVVAIALGARRSRRWVAAERATGGRLRAMALQTDPSSIFAAADVYLDSFPIGSVTSALEAAALGIPVVTLAPHRDFGWLVTANSPGLDEGSLRPSDEDELVDVIRDLATSSERRTRLGGEVRDAVAESHLPAAWRTRLGEVLEWLERPAREEVVDRDASIGQPGEIDAVLHGLHAHSSLRARLFPLRKSSSRHAPPDAVLAEVVRLCADRALHRR